MEDYEKNVQKLASALCWIPADDYNIYRDVVAALKHEALTGTLTEDDAVILARTWAASSSKFDEKEFIKKWRSFTDSYVGDLIGAGSIIKMAKDYGYKPAAAGSFNGELFGVGATIDLSALVASNGHGSEAGAALPSYPLSEVEQERQILRFLDLYSDDDRVNIVFTAFEREGKWIPEGKGITRPVKEWRQSIHDSFRAGKGPFSQFFTSTDDSGKTVSYNPAAGVWVRLNPVDGHGVADNNVTSWRYALIESDNMAKIDQLRIVKNIGCTALAIDSGKKSIHAVVDLGASNLMDYRRKVVDLQATCNKMGLQVDPNTKNPSRLMRLPGIKRGENFQRIVWDPPTATRMTYSTWVAFMAYGAPVDIATNWDSFDPDKARAPVLIDGILRRGHKMAISAASKAGKSFLAIELGAAAATGTDWLGYKCAKGRVLYCNMEIDPGSFATRVHEVFAARGHPWSPEEGYFMPYNLRGKIVSPEKLAELLIHYCRSKDFSYIIIDPLYKVLIGLDENSAGDIGKAVTFFDKIAQETGAAVITTLHFSKGSSYSKSQMAATDRASGSGVFGRDPDAICTLLQLAWDPVAMNRPNRYETAWRLNFTLREFPDPGEKDIFFDYPVHVVDSMGLLKELPYAGAPQIAGGRTRGAAMASDKQQAIINVTRDLHQRLRTPGGRCDIVNGHPTVSRAEIERDLGLGKNSIYNYLTDRTIEDPENGERYILQAGKFFREEDLT